MAPDDNKKRKRQSNGAVSAPNKKVAIHNDTKSSKAIAVSYVNNKNASRPVIASSPGLAPPQIPFKAYCKSSDKNDFILHSSKHPRLDYTALPDPLDAGLAHYIAVFDPASSKLQVIPARSLSLRGAVRMEQDAESAEKKGPTYAQQREDLGREFGTKKAKKAIASKTENAIVSGKDGKGKSTVTETQTAILESVGLNTAGNATREEQAQALLASKPIPPPNLDAESVEDVYPLSTLLPSSDARLVDIKEWQEKTKNKVNIEFDHRFTAFRLQKIVKSGDVSRLKALRYLTVLLEFHDALQGGRVKKVPAKNVLAEKIPTSPSALVDSVRRRFANDSGSELGKFQLDKLYTHICALSLFVDGWATDITNLKDDLKLETRVLAKYFQELGCQVKPPNDTERATFNIHKSVAAVTRVAKLKLPLVFPKVSRRRA